MGFYDISGNIDRYIEMCSGYDGSYIYKILEEFLKKDASVLELGSGPGLDIPFLNSLYNVTGSDLSEQFLSRLEKKYPDITFLKIDAVEIDVKGSFDCIYSNKVLPHLTKEELKSSLISQFNNLDSNGIIAHTFWIGDENEEVEGLLFTKYQKQEIIDIFSNQFRILSLTIYKEFEESDSMFVIAQKK